MRQPRKAETYRAFRRNEARRAGKLAEWRETAYAQANSEAKLVDRAAQANAAREVAVKAIVAAGPLGRIDAVANDAMLKFYRGEKPTRVVNRIVRTLKRNSVALASAA